MQGSLMVGIMCVYRHAGILIEDKCVYNLHTWWPRGSDHTCVLTHMQRILMLESQMCFSTGNAILWQKQHVCVYTYVGYSLDKDLMSVSVYTHMGALS